MKMNIEEDSFILLSSDNSIIAHKEFPTTYYVVGFHYNSIYEDDSSNLILLLRHPSAWYIYVWGTNDSFSPGTAVLPYMYVNPTYNAVGYPLDGSSQIWAVPLTGSSIL